MRDKGDDKGLPDDGDRFTVAEMHDSIEALSDADVAKLVAASRAFCRLCGITPDDLLQEAYTRALEGRRTCHRGTGIVEFLCGVMKSLASQENEARKEGLRPVVVMRNGEPVLPDVAADMVSPEQAAASAIDDRGALAAIEGLVANDEPLQLLIEGIDDDMRGADQDRIMSQDHDARAKLAKLADVLMQDIIRRPMPRLLPRSARKALNGREPYLPKQNRKY
jgi:DNA-directed RNA polymerase specialized sigma24 family protein